MSSKGGNANFSEEEKVFLAELGKQYPDIENKGYDNASLKRKKTSCGQIAKTFNAGNPDGKKRDLKAIQGCWKRMKIKTKKEFDEHTRESKKPGGGKAPASPNAVSKMVADIILASVNPVENEFDDDAVEPAASDVELSKDTYKAGPSVGPTCSMQSTSPSLCIRRPAKRKQKETAVGLANNFFYLFYIQFFLHY